jgi:lipid-binding SYLF domain-containing protein
VRNEEVKARELENKEAKNMENNSLKQMGTLGRAIWLEYIRRVPASLGPAHSPEPVCMQRRRKMMKRVLLCSLFLALVAAFNVPVTYADGMQDDVDRAVTTIMAFRNIPEKSIPPEVLRNAKGVAIMTVIKAGFIVSGRAGSGVVVARLGKGWSGPSAIGTGGAGFGLQIGAEQTEFVIVLNTRDAVKAFSQGGNVQLGGDISVAAGPVGRTVEAGVTPVAAVYTYSRSQGLFGGISLEGTVVATRNDANAQYYGRAVTPGQILSGKVKVPAGAKPLQRALAKY